MTRWGQEATALLLSAVVHAGVLCLPAASLLQAERSHEPLAVSLDLQGETRSAASEETDNGFSAEDHQPVSSEIAGPVEEPSNSRPKQAQPQPREDRGPTQPGMPEPETVPPVAEDMESLPPIPDPASHVEVVDQEPDFDSAAGRLSSELESAIASPAASGTDEGERATGSKPEEGSHGGADGHSEAPEKERGERRGKKRQVEKAEILPAHLFAPKPPYPARSRDLGEEGTVIIAILVGEDGRVVECRVASSSGHPPLDGSALATVRQKWRFKPGRSAGEPVARWVRVPVEFRIRKR